MTDAGAIALSASRLASVAIQGQAEIFKATTELIGTAVKSIAACGQAYFQEQNEKLLRETALTPAQCLAIRQSNTKFERGVQRITAYRGPCLQAFFSLIQATQRTVAIITQYDRENRVWILNRAKGAVLTELDTSASRDSGSISTNKKRPSSSVVDRGLIKSVLYPPEKHFYNTTASGIVLVLNKARLKERKRKVFLVNASQVLEKWGSKNLIPEARHRPRRRHLPVRTWR